MTISKIVRIQSVGRFTNLSAAGDVQFAKLTVVYGDNGSGKTTLAGLLRSLATGSSAFVDERSTLGATTPSEAQILLSGAVAKFSNGGWDRTLPDLEIFDSTFVGENVYTGDRVDVEHRKNLYQVVVGAAAVALAKRIDELNADGRQLAKKIRGIEAELSKRLQAPFTLGEFLGLESEPALDEKIASVTTELNAARRSAKVVSRPQLQPLTPPGSPRDLAELLDTQVAAMSQEVEERVRRHIQEHLDGTGEQWLRQGLGYVRGGSCPFCAQGLEGSTLVQLYGQFFSATYREHVIRIQQALNALRQRYSDERLTALERVATENASRVATWEDLADLSAASSDLRRTTATWRAARAKLEAALQRKLEDPGSPVPGMESVEAAVRDLEEAIAEFGVFNERIANANARIAGLKQKSASANQDALEAELRRLRNQQIRYEPEVVALCDELNDARQKKAQQEATKETVRADLEREAGALLADYEGDINRLLAGFGANFRITGTKPVFPGGNASSTYQIEINGVPLALGDAKTPRGTPCFKTALSAGDKSTLALAFFLAKLKRDTNLGSKVIVFDDPLSSLDSFRISFTQHELTRLASLAAQTVVLSHDPFFLAGIVNADSGRTAKPLRISRKGQTHTIREWEIAKECMPQAHKDYFVLCRFMDEGLPDDGDLVTVARAIRPYVESYLRLKFPDKFPSGHMLGTFVKAVRDAEPGDSLHFLQPKVQELEDINAYGRRFPHDNPGQTTEAEVQAYISKAFNFVRS